MVDADFNTAQAICMGLSKAQRKYLKNVTQLIGHKTQKIYDELERFLKPINGFKCIRDYCLCNPHALPFIPGYYQNKIGMMENENNIDIALVGLLNYRILDAKRNYRDRMMECESDVEFQLHILSGSHLKKIPDNTAENKMVNENTNTLSSIASLQEMEVCSGDMVLSTKENSIDKSVCSLSLSDSVPKQARNKSYIIHFPHFCHKNISVEKEHPNTTKPSMIAHEMEISPRAALGLQEAIGHKVDKNISNTDVVHLKSSGSISLVDTHEVNDTLVVTLDIPASLSTETHTVTHLYELQKEGAVHIELENNLNPERVYLKKSGSISRFGT
jgi:hypothetical protein